ncbi:MAG: HAD family hydrolase [Thaumarchaeota archaeon]|nr:HAD family hydrolase [Nitrososphaerota archaeon]
MLRGIIFDLDGTLISLHVDGAAFRREIAKELTQGGFKLDFTDASIKGLYVQEMLDLAKSQIDQGLVKGEYAHVRKRTFRALDALEVEWIRHSQLLPGAEAILSRLSGEGKAPITLALLTNSGRAATTYAMEALGFKKYFQTTFTRDDVPAMKPRPDGIATALTTLGLGKGEVLYVGDSPIDIIAARGAGIPIASVASVRYGAEALRKLGADYALGSISELEDLLPRLG